MLKNKERLANFPMRAGTLSHPSQEACNLSYRMMQKAVRIFVNTVYDFQVKGHLPLDGSRLLLSPHQNDLDGFALLSGIDGPVSIIFSSYGLENLPIRPLLNTSGGIPVFGHGHSRYIGHKRMFHSFDEGSILFGFPQACYQKDVSRLEPGLVGLAGLYERKTGKGVSIIPVGIKYGSSSEPKIFPLRYLRFPFPGTSVTVSFGEPKHLDGHSPKELTEIVMKEAAELSNVPYRVQPT